MDTKLFVKIEIVMAGVLRSILSKLQSHLDHANLESITVEIFKPKAKLFLTRTWYRPPGTSISLDLFNENKEVITIEISTVIGTISQNVRFHLRQKESLILLKHLNTNN
jgi:hypothetical protein